MKHLMFCKQQKQDYVIWKSICNVTRYGITTKLDVIKLWIMD